jgi:hypothetical protein
MLHRKGANPPLGAAPFFLVFDLEFPALSQDLTTSQAGAGEIITWYTLDIDEGDGSIDLRLYETVEDALEDARLALGAGMHPLALWNGAELLMKAAEIEEQCRRSNDDVAS